jgi:hypothetical protein
VICPAGNFINGPVAAGGDVGKLIIIPASAGSTGRIAGLNVASGGTGGTDGLQAITSTNANCGSDPLNQPVMYVQVTGGVPTGAVQINGQQYGYHCTTLPTTATVATVTGTVNLTGGQFQPADNPTTIIAVISPTQITVQDPATVTVTNYPILYGADDNDGTGANGGAWNDACAAMGNPASPTSIGHLTQTGISMISHGIDCKGAALAIDGQGWATYPSLAGGSALVYAGRNTGDHIIQMASGWGSQLIRMRISGNSLAQPDGLLLSEGVSGLGNGNNASGWYDHLWFGSMFGDGRITSFAVSPNLRTCVYSHAVFGNNDFNIFGDNYCLSSEYGTNTDNNQATNWVFQEWHAQYNKVGFVQWGNETVRDLYGEFNRTLMMMGSPDNSGGNPGVLHVELLGDESSAQLIASSPLFYSYKLKVDNAFGVSLSICPGCLQPNGVAIDLTHIGNGEIEWNGFSTGQILRSAPCSTSAKYTFTGVGPSVFSYTAPPVSGCAYTAAQKDLMYVGDINTTGTATIDVDAYNYYNRGLTTEQEHDNIYSQIWGSLDVVSPQPPSESLGVGVIGTPGSTTYTYQLTCKDGAGREGPYSTTTTTTGNATLSGTNYNRIDWVPNTGCETVCLYGDEGSGSIGLLSCIKSTLLTPASSVPYNNVFISDTGTFTKDTTNLPPTTTSSGLVNTDGGFQVNNQYFQTWHLADWNPTAISSFKGDVPINDGDLFNPSFLFPNQTGIPGITAGSGTTTEGNTSNAGGGTAVNSGEIDFYAISPTQNILVSDMQIYVTSFLTLPGDMVVGLYKTDGLVFPGSPYKKPGTKICQSAQTTLAVGWNVIILPSCKLSAGKTYYMGFLSLAAAGHVPTIPYNSQAGLPHYGCFYSWGGSAMSTMPPNMTHLPMTCGNNISAIPPNAYPGLYVDGALQPFLNTTNSTGVAGHATCWKTTGTIGYCSTVVDALGNCTCN